MAQESEEPPLSELIILCCHSIYLGSSSGMDPSVESSWHLSSFQSSKGSNPGEHETFILHILSSLFLLSQHRDSLLVISGGPTAREAIEQSEAQSYFDACEVLYNKDHPCFEKVWDEVKERVLLEETATDSYQNLLFSILVFRRRTGQYPQRVTVVSHAFKSSRFLKLHAQAIQWPVQRIAVQGVNPPFPSRELGDAEEGESKACEAFARDPYGSAKELSRKRRSRGWKESMIQLLGDGLEPSVQALLQWKGGESGQETFPHELPWAR
ncbi:MAG: hypothetical protein M1822_000395 [Bathelium mastoideum]|nr:MAG: hypothetical protein M1822_000395 [Bathelium mastoideum]